MPVEGKPHYRMTQDGLVNLVSGLGTSRDKGGQAQYYVQPMSDGELVQAYKGSSLIRRVVDMPATDCFREWREWQAETSDIGLIEAEEKRLGIKLKMMRAKKFARLLGGAALLIGDGATNPAEPLDPVTIKKGGLKYLTMLTMRDVTPWQLETNITSANFGNPKHWTLNTQGNTGVQIHPSRLVVFHGQEPLGDYDTAMNRGWGDSVLMGGLDAIRRVDEAAGNILSLIYEAKVDVFGIPDLMQNLSSRGTDYSNEIIRRVTLAATAKGINGMLIRDTLETYDQKSASFGTLDALLDRFMQLACAAWGIPMTLLFGTSPGGLNATGAGDTRGYYDAIKTIQSNEIEPAISVLDECLIRSAIGDRPAKVHYNWRPLWQQSAKERADTAKTLVDALVALDNAELVPGDVLGAAAVSALTETGAFPGLESANEKHFGGDDDE